MRHFRQSPRRRHNVAERGCALEQLENRQLLSAALPNIMPMGDSITEAEPGHASYRYWLWNSLADAGYTTNFVGTGSGVGGGAALYPGFDTDHEGHSGFTAADLRAMLESSDWKSFALQPQNKPDIVMLQIGNNDVEDGHANKTTIKIIGKIIDDLRAVNSRVTILLSQITPEKGLSVSGLNNLLPALAKSMNTKRSRVTLVKQANGFKPAADTYDGVHPNQAGEQMLAAKWFAALKPLLPKPKKPLGGVYLDAGSVPLTSSTNAVGPVEYEESNGSDSQYDGQPLTLRGQTYIRGFGVHAPSEMDFDLSGGSYSQFRAVVGVDDEVSGAGTVDFQVFVNGEPTPRYDSGPLTGTDAAMPVVVNIQGATSLQLVVTDAGDGNASDHADWALARLIAAIPLAQPSHKVPNAPRKLRIQFVGGKVDLSWIDESNNEYGFDVQRRIGTRGNWMVLDQTDPNRDSDTDAHVLDGLHYYYRIMAYNNAGASKASNTIDLVIPPST